MNKVFLSVIFLFIITSFISLHAQWARTYGVSSGDYAYSIQQTSDGGYIVSRGNHILKLSSSGDIEWQRTYGGSSYDSASSFLPTSDGGYIVAGKTSSFGAGEDDIWILKLSSSGDIEWQKTYGESDSEYPDSIQQTSDGGYIVAASIVEGENPDSSYRLWILKIFPSGDIEWQKTYGESDSDYADSIQQTSDGGYIVSGGNHVLKLSSSGDIEWQRTYGGSRYDSASSFLPTNDGGYIVAGKTFSFGAGEDDIWTLKLSSSGDIEWQKTYGGSDSDHPFSIQQTSDGGYIVIGSTQSFGAGGEDIWIIKLSSEGDIEWQRTYGGSRYDNASSFLPTNDGGYIVVGYSTSFGTQWDDNDIWIIKLFPSGVIEWQKTYGGNYSRDVAYSIQQTSDGGYIVAGLTSSWGDGSQYLALKLLQNGDINARCAFIENSNGQVSVTNIMPENTIIIPRDTNIIPEDTNITPLDTGILPLDTDVNVYKLGVSDICTLTLSASSGGTTNPAPGVHTYDIGTEVTLTAITLDDYIFISWKGNVQSGDNPITLRMDGDKTINAHIIFNLLKEYIEQNCFIATAAYGSPLHPHVEILRDFRDKYLMSNKLGRMVVDFYYKYSPSVAKIIARSKPLKVIVRTQLIPIIVLSYSMVHLGPIMTGVMLIFIFMLPFFIVMFHRRKIRYVR